MARTTQFLVLLAVAACACAPHRRAGTWRNREPDPPVTPAELPPGVVAFDATTMTQPEKLSGPDPQYTSEAIKNCVQGTALVRCIVTEEGTVHGCRVIQSLPYMDATLVNALEHRRYRPVTSDGKRLAVLYTFRVTMRVFGCR